MRIFLQFAIICISTLLLNGQDTSKVTIYNAKLFVGKQVTVCDKVVDIFRPSGENKPIYINFGAKYPDHVFTAVIFAKDLPSLPYNPIEAFKDKEVCISGTIAEYKGKPQIVLNGPKQITLKQ